MINKNKGFTLVELMVVIVILSILTISASSLDFSKKTTSEKRDRLLNRITSIIDTEKLNSKAGKGVNIGTTDIINPTFSKISISTGSIIVNYYTGTNVNSLTNKVGTGEILLLPFFGDNNYNISSLSYDDKNGSSGIGTSFDIIFDNISNNITFSGSNGASLINPLSIITLKIKAGYSKDYKTINFDKRTGKINY